MTKYPDNPNDGSHSDQHQVEQEQQQQQQLTSSTTESSSSSNNNNNNKASPTETTTSEETNDLSNSNISSSSSTDGGGDHVVPMTVLESKSVSESIRDATDGRRQPSDVEEGQQQQNQQQQTRFSFYDASEVEKEYVSSMPKPSASPENARNKGTTPATSEKKHNRFHFYDPSIMPASTTPTSLFLDRDRNRMEDTIKEGTAAAAGTNSTVSGNGTSGGGTSTTSKTSDEIGQNHYHRERLTASDRNNSSHAAVPPPSSSSGRKTTKHPNPHRLGSEQLSHADEILRSLQETEEQRMNILKSSTTTNTNKINSNSTNSNGGRGGGGGGGGRGTTAIPNKKPSRIHDSRQNSSSTSKSMTVETLRGRTTSSSGIVKSTATTEVVNTRGVHLNSKDEDNNSNNVQNNNNSDNVQNNPYEDAIKEALDLLRRHRSPTSSPPATTTTRTTTGVHLSSHNGAAGDDDDNIMPTLKSEPPMTVRIGKSRSSIGGTDPSNSDHGLDHESALHSTGDIGGSSSSANGIDGKVQLEVHAENNVDGTGGDESGHSAKTSTTTPHGALQEAKLKAKKRQERMAEYANRLQEFKSTLPADEHQDLQPSSSYASQQDDSPSRAAAVTTADISLTPAQHTNTVPPEVMPSDEKQYQHLQQQQHPKSIQPRYIQPSASADSAGIISELSHGTSKPPKTTTNASIAVSRSNDRLSAPTTTEEDHQRTVEEEVQKGVEKVLLAILEASKNKGSSGSVASNGGGLDDVSLANSNTGGGGGGSSQISEALLRAMDEVLNKNSVGSSGSSSIISDDNRSITKTARYGSSNASKLSLGGKSHTSSRSKQSCGERSVVDELLAEDDDYFRSDPSSVRQGNSNNKNNNNWPVEEKKVTDDGTGPAVPNDVGKSNSTATYQQCEKDINRFAPTPEEHDFEDSQDQEVTEDYGSAEEEFDDDDRADSYDDDEETYDDDGRSYDEVEDENDHHQRQQSVLGPLSRRAGGTTGVVLDNMETTEGDNQPGSKGYFSSVVNYVTSALTPDQQQLLEQEQAEKAKELAVNQANDSSTYHPEEGNNAADENAMELMRTLCAHLLPYGVDRSSDAGSSLPEWDEENENEAGYRIIRLTRSQLRLVERAFEVMITRLKNKSQNQLNGLEGEYDANFIRELQEAERLLDDQEKQLGSKESGSRSTPAPTLSTDVSSSHEGVHEVPNDVDSTTDTEEGHPDFPGIKNTGRGEMGDLEYFHLPIIFKSHVTGFEPTKDMVLEPGNIVAGQYLVESELGSAAFSTAYRCIDLSSNDQEGHEEVCLKVIKNTKDFFDQSLDEIKILELLRQTGKCDENYIVRMKTFFYYREHLVIVTELLRQNLFEFGKFITDNGEEPYFTIPRLAYITRQCLVALRFVHGLGLVHSDVKPENILLGSYSRAKIKLIDFGSSCYLTDRQSSYIQSRSYRAPEVVLGLPYDGRIDVWSLGCVVAEMYTGEVTFQNDSIVSMLSRIEAICGSFPRHMIAQGRQSGRFFTKSGLLYEVVDESDRDTKKSPPGPDDSGHDTDSESEMSVLFDIFQPKNTNLASRLGFEPDLMDGFDMNDFTGQVGPTEFDLEQLFTDFVGRLLTIDPDGRPNADEALRHPFMIYASTLTEERVKYPSS